MQKFKKKSELYKKAVEELTSQGKFRINLGLERITSLLDYFGNPQEKLKIIHVAGTNGKGSVCVMLASILKESGCKTGLYTSPHLVEYTERIKINDEAISQKDFGELISEIIKISDEIELGVSEFEILTAAAYIYFARSEVDFVVLETGLGGRFDATNLIKAPLASVITSIDLDHIDRLGDTVEKIAFEKAGIIKNNCPIITIFDNKGLDVIKQVAEEKKSKIYFTDENLFKEVLFENDFNVLKTEKDEYKLQMLGLWQKQNASIVLKTIEVLQKQGLAVVNEDIKNGLQKAIWPARFQYIKEKNLVIDGAHNPFGARLLRKSLDFYFPDKKRVWLYASLNTKDYKTVIKELFKAGDSVILTEFNSSNCVKIEELESEIRKTPGISIKYANANVTKSLGELYSNSNSDFNSISIIAGSLYMAGEVLTLLANK